jgi:hypothetical protein
LSSQDRAASRTSWVSALRADCAGVVIGESPGCRS